MSTPTPRRVSGIGRVLIVVYGILALAATGRSVFQIATKFEVAPLAYTLSAVSAVIYILATIALVAPGPIWYRVAWVTISIELAGVLSVGLLSLLASGLFPTDRDSTTVWSYFGSGYLFVPLVLPILGMVWLSRRRKVGG